LFYTKFGGKHIAAVPIKEKFPVKEDIKVKRLTKIYCVSIIHKGSWKNIDDYLNKLFNYIKTHKLFWRSLVREIYLQCDG
jgi:effector-binding domain-containing protein